MKGRKPVSDNLKVIRGTNQPCRMRGELIVERIDQLPKAPREMGRTARKYFNEVGIYILRAKILTAVDVGVLEMCSIEYGRYHDITYEIEKINQWDDMTEDQEKKLKRMNRFMMQSYERWLKLAIELGLTPSSRLKFHVKQEEPDELQSIMHAFK
jgi:P27 family predicted phage terminase small subunit